MPSIQYKIQSIATKFYLKRQLESLLQSPHQLLNSDSVYGIISRPNEAKAPANPSFSGDDGVATKDVHIDPLSSLNLRIFLPDSAIISSPESHTISEKLLEKEVYKGYQPDKYRRNCKKLPVILQFHGGIWVTGGNNTMGNDSFCRNLAKSCEAIVVAVGYRLAPESKYPAAFEDGVKVLYWLGMQANLADRNLGNFSQRFGGGGGGRRQQIVDGSLATMIDPWLAAHADPSRCVILGISSGANIANYVTQNAVNGGKISLHPLNVVAQVLMHPLFMGSVPTLSEKKLANSYIYDKAISLLAWKLFLPAEKEFSLDHHPAANPLNTIRGVSLKDMPPTLTVVAEYDWTRDRAIAYCEELRKVNVDAPLLDYKNTVHDFVTVGSLLKTPVAKACIEDVGIWMKKYISLRDNEFSYFQIEMILKCG